ncbi:hypothetical protein [Luteibacter sp. CQ10]|uniref:hypothetical protein n=1 Tax=Luteibacter sp. CQ10 TaxID=2805821 RepID=UPI0034A49C37
MKPDKPFAALAATLTWIWFTVAREEAAKDSNSSTGVVIICAIAWLLSLAAAWKYRNAPERVRENFACPLCGTIPPAQERKDDETELSKACDAPQEALRTKRAAWKLIVERVMTALAVFAALFSLAVTILAAQEWLPDLPLPSGLAVPHHVWMFLVGIAPVFSVLAKSRIAKAVSFIYANAAIDMMMLGWVLPE